MQEQRDLVRWFLPVYIEHAHELTAGVTITARQRNVLTEVPAQVDHANERVSGWNRCQGLSRVISTAVVDEDQLRHAGDVVRRQVPSERLQILLAKLLGQIGVVEDGHDKRVLEHRSGRAAVWY